jgi:hypothetical protein
VLNGKLHVDASGLATAGWRYTLININGQQVAQGALPLTTGSRSCEIKLPPELQPGIYYLSLNHANESTILLPVVLQ